MSWTKVTPNVMRHFCAEALRTETNDAGSKDVVPGRQVMTSFPEERCPYCKARPPVVVR